MSEKRKLEKHPASFTCDQEYGNLYYFAVEGRKAPPYLTQRHVNAIVDIASDGTLAGVELIDDMPPPPVSAPMSDPSMTGDGLEAASRAAMVANGCGLTIEGKHVLCDSPGGLELPGNCECRKMAEAAVAAYLDVTKQADEIERLTRERDELAAANDAIEIDAGLTENGNLWRYWSTKAQEVVAKQKADRARIAVLEAALTNVLNVVSDTLSCGRHCVIEADSRDEAAYAAEIRAARNALVTP